MTIASSGVVNNFSIIYISIGVLPSNVCDNCAEGLVAYEKQYVSSCHQELMHLHMQIKELLAEPAQVNLDSFFQMENVLREP